jgi:hypothetical protein
MNLKNNSSNIEYITGNKFKNFCHYYFDGKDLIFNKPHNDNHVLNIFIKTDFIDLFFQSYDFNHKVIIFTHNSDYGIDFNHIKYLDNPNIVSWYAQNINTVHPKLKSIPIGIANEEWPHGDINTFESIRIKNLEKTNLIYANFNTYTNLNERNHCVNYLNKQNILVSPSLKFDKYLSNLSKSYFSISPNGNGVDCHKTWESLYLKTIPILTKSINSLQYRNLPIIILDDWRDFDISNFSIELYHSLWYNFDIKKLNFSNYVSSILHS